MAKVGFLHTSPVHVGTFDGLVDQYSPGTRTVHVVDEALLADARASGPEATANAVRGHLRELVSAGVEIICCTCSTIGDVAERATAAVQVIRVDRPMARRAVALGPRIGVVAALESTLEPTRALIAEESRRLGTAVSVELLTAHGAWHHFESGDRERYRAEIVTAASSLASRVDVIVLAQASMAGAGPHLRDLRTPVLSSPGLAVEYLVSDV